MKHLNRLLFGLGIISVVLIIINTIIKCVTTWPEFIGKTMFILGLLTFAYLMGADFDDFSQKNDQDE